MNIWLNKDKCISMTFDKTVMKDGIKVTTNHAVKGIDSIYQKMFCFFGLIFTYEDFNYNRIINIMINHQKHNYSRSKNHHEINVLKDTLMAYTKNRPKYISTPFNWNYSVDKHNGETIYYITGKKKWFEDNNLGDLVNGYVEICGKNEIIDNKDKFPKYNPNNTHPHVFVIDY